MTAPSRRALSWLFGEYSVFGALLANSLSDGRPTLRLALFAIVIASLYGVTDEFHQHFTPGRVPDAADWALDTIGATVGALALVAWKRWRER